MTRTRRARAPPKTRSASNHGSMLSSGKVELGTWINMSAMRKGSLGRADSYLIDTPDWLSGRVLDLSTNDGS